MYEFLAITIERDQMISSLHPHYLRCHTKGETTGELMDNVNEVMRFYPDPFHSCDTIQEAPKWKIKLITVQGKHILENQFDTVI